MLIVSLSSCDLDSTDRDCMKEGLRVKLKRSQKLAALVAAPLVGLPLASPAAFATPAGDNVVINEVYVRGGNGDGVYRDYVELYNPTDSAISLDGMSLQYFSATGNKGNGTTTLSGEIAPGGYYLVLGKDETHTTEVDADATGGMAMGAKGGSIVLFDVTSTQTLSGNPLDLAGADGVIDAFGWGTAGLKEAAALSSTTTSSQSYQRTAGADTDNNSVDFTVAAPSPTKSGAEVTEPSEPTDPVEPPVVEPDTITPIADIQGTGSATPLNGQTVTTRGIVTAVYATGGFNGVVIQTPGEQAGIPAASNAVFVYGSKFAGAVEIGDYVEVKGTATEYQDKTQISSPTWTILDNTEGLTASPLTIETFPATEAEREALESMLVTVTGTHMITDNYSANRYGEIFIVAGDEPLYQPSDIYNPTQNPEEIAALDAANKARVFSFDDGMSWDLTKFDQNNDDIPAPWFDVENPARVGASVTFNQPMIMDFLRGTWKLQPTGPVNVAGEPDHSADWITLSNNERPAAPGDFGGDLTVSSFNVLNYFTTRGTDLTGCSAYNDRAGDGVTVNSGCDARGAWDTADLERQQTKIVAAINELDSSIIGLEEIENSIHFGDDRDAALKTLVAALNEDAGYEKWAAVESPADLPSDEDVIRLAFIYQIAEAAPVGDSQILIGSDVISGSAREPLAQKFTAVDASGQAVGEDFVVVVNHLKSKGSLANPGDEDVYQGNNNLLRVQQVTALTSWINDTFAGEPVFIIGDLNSYSKEDPIVYLEEQGYTNIAEYFAVENRSYLYSGLIGSLDHGLANEAALALVTGADVWNVNAMEPLAFEYSRYNYNVDGDRLFDLTAYRSSDHDPIKFGLNTVAEPVDTETPTDDVVTDDGVADDGEGGGGAAGSTTGGAAGSASGTGPTDPVQGKLAKTGLDLVQLSIALLAILAVGAGLVRVSGREA